VLRKFNRLAFSKTVLETVLSKRHHSNEFRELTLRATQKNMLIGYPSWANPAILGGSGCYRALRHPWRARRYQSLIRACRLPSLSLVLGNGLLAQTVSACPLPDHARWREPAFERARHETRFCAVTGSVAPFFLP
jgi:hypothetical protein